MLERRFLFILFFQILSTVLVLVGAPASRQPWILFSGVLFLGIAALDLQRKSIHSWVRVIGFCVLFFLVLMAVISQTVEEFWRMTGAAFLVLALHYEMNSSAWSGSPLRRSTVFPSIVFILLALVQGIGFVPADISLMAGLAALLLLACLEIGIMLRHKAEDTIGTYISSLRLGLSGISCLFYTSVFLPSVFKTEPFTLFILILAIFGGLLAIISLFLKDLRRRHVLFTASWTILILWAALTGEAERLYAGALASLFGAWSIGMMSAGGESISKPANTFLFLSGWCVPGSFMFTALICVLHPSDLELVRITSVIWIFVMAFFGLGLARFSWDQASRENGWAWQVQAALITNILGVCLIAFIRFLPEIGARYWEGFR